MTLVIIPARMGSTRLPGKPLLKIGDRTIIERCVGRARRAGFKATVATDSQEIVDIFDGTGVQVVMTGECASGTDRVAAAAEIIDPEGKHEFVINYQGDMPFLDRDDLQDFIEYRLIHNFDVVTAYSDLEAVVISRPAGFKRVKLASHVGLYGYTRAALRKFASLPQSAFEIEERLEQGRAIDKFDWGFCRLHSMPIEINTQADLDRARSCLT